MPNPYSHTNASDPSQHTYAGDSVEDLSEAEFRPRRGASIRARSVIANACGVRRVTQTGRTASRRMGVKEESEAYESRFFPGKFSGEFKNFAVPVYASPPTETGSLVDPPSRPIVRVSDSSPWILPKRRIQASDESPSSSSGNRSTTFAATRIPNKSQRQVFDCVLIISRKAKSEPKLDSVLSQELNLSHPAKSYNETELEKIKSWKNPKVKKKEDFTLLPDTIRNRIRNIGFEIQEQYFDVDRSIREVMVTREFISHEYGGSCRTTKPNIAKKFVDVHGMNDFYFVNSDYDPQPPELPGAPGLKLATKPGPDKGRLRVMTKIKNINIKHDNQYLYVGQYDVMRADPPFLSIQEWKAQSSKFHNKWAQGMVTRGWGKGVLCRVLGRKMYGREPTEEECKNIEKSGRFKEVTKEEVKEAYFSGQEQMGVWTMKCVGYDNNFQKDLSTKFSRWVPQTKDSKTKPKEVNLGDDMDEEEKQE